MLTAQEIFNKLVGKWRFARTIVGMESKKNLTISGVAVFSKVNNTSLHYREDGILSMGREYSVYREYYYELESNSILKFFCNDLQKQEIFYRLFFNDLKLVKATHICKDDCYEAEYDFSRLMTFDEFILLYKIKGPNKDEIICTEFKKSDNF